MAKKSREYRLTETKYVSEYLQEFYSDDWYKFPFRLASEADLEHYREAPSESRGLLTRQWATADAVIAKENKLIIVEAKLKPYRYKNALGALLLYREFVETTPQLEDHWGKPVEAQLVTPVEARQIHKICRQHDVRNVIWTPEWFDDYLETLAPRERRSPRYGR